jgi:hypothetical protein
VNRASRSGPLIAVVVTAAIICSLGLGIVGYWRYATSVAPFMPQLPPMPKPNGFERAVKAARGLPWAKYTARRSGWLKGTPMELRAQLTSIRPILDEVRATFRLEWRVPRVKDAPGAESTFSEPWWEFRACERSFDAETNLARSLGDYSSAIQRSLDAMELGAKCTRGGPLRSWRAGLAYHEIGFSQAEQIVPRLPARAIPAALERVRRVRNSWPPLSELWEGERIETLSFYTDAFLSIRRRPLREQIEGLFSSGEDQRLWRAVQRALTPRRWVLADVDRFYLRLIAESQKPIRQRNSVLAFDNPWLPSGYFAPDPEEQHSWRFEFAQTELALLEVALAVRLYHLHHGSYPADLGAIERHWLTVIPVDQWDQHVGYRLKGGKPLIYSLGPDGKDDGGQDANVRDLDKTARGDLVFGRLNWDDWRDSQPWGTGIKRR